MTLEHFFSQLQNHFASSTFIKATIGNQRNKKDVLKNVSIKMVLLKNEMKYCFVYKNATNHITKNFSEQEALDQIKELLQLHFLNMDVFTTSSDMHVLQSNNGSVKIKTKGHQQALQEIDLQHNKVKTRLVGSQSKTYLKALGICGPNGDVRKEMQHKFKQINRYVEILSDVLRDANMTQEICVADMGSGKGYLTFALAEFLSAQYQSAKIVGVEMRLDMVTLCNTIAAESKMDNLHFEQGTIKETNVPQMNVLIALHACDTATDDAIKKGIAANVQIIVCAPCCHKQVRKSMKAPTALHPIVKHGILLERQAEIITDSLRALWLESNGYKTKVFDFVDVNDTPKNVMIVAIKTKRTDAELKNYAQQYADLKTMYGVPFCAVEIA
jgi:hypothetical protein